MNHSKLPSNVILCVTCKQFYRHFQSCDIRFLDGSNNCKLRLVRDSLFLESDSPHLVCVATTRENVGIKRKSLFFYTITHDQPGYVLYHRSCLQTKVVDRLCTTFRNGPILFLERGFGVSHSLFVLLHRNCLFLQGEIKTVLLLLRRFWSPGHIHQGQHSKVFAIDNKAGPTNSIQFKLTGESD